MDAFANTMPPMRRRIAAASGSRRVWHASTAQREWMTSSQTHSWNRCSSSSYICLLPHLVGLRPLPTKLLKHFSVRLAEMREDARPRRKQPHRLWWLRDGLQVSDPSALPIGTMTEGRSAPTGGERVELETTKLKAMLAALRLGLTPVYCPRLAASLAVRIGLHPAYAWDEALLSHEMFLTLGWVGLLLDRGGAWMPAAVAEYLADVIGIDDAGHHHINEPLLADVMVEQDLRIAVADAAETRLQRDESFLRWPNAKRRVTAEWGLVST